MREELCHIIRHGMRIPDNILGIYVCLWLRYGVENIKRTLFWLMRLGEWAPRPKEIRYGLPMSVFYDTVDALCETNKYRTLKYISQEFAIETDHDEDMDDYGYSITNIPEYGSVQHDRYTHRRLGWNPSKMGYIPVLQYMIRNALISDYIRPSKLINIDMRCIRYISMYNLLMSAVNSNNYRMFKYVFTNPLCIECSPADYVMCIIRCVDDRRSPRICKFLCKTFCPNVEPCRRNLRRWLTEFYYEDPGNRIYDIMNLRIGHFK